MKKRKDGHSALRPKKGGGFETFDPHPQIPVHLGEDGTEQFDITTRVNGKIVGAQKIHDPFIRSTVKLRGFGHAWNALFGGLKVEIAVNASEGASRAIMTLNPVVLAKDTEDILEQRRLSREAHARGDYSGSDCQSTSTK